MPAASDRAEFAPPPQPAALQAFAMAIIAHLLLLLALTWGINWKRESENVVAEAELWSSVPQQAAPRVVQAPPIVAAPTPVPAPAPVPAPPPPPPPPPAPREAAPPPPPLPAKQPDIALEREKKRQELAERRREELEQQKKIDARREREEAERARQLEARRKQEDLKREQLAQQKAEDDRKRREEQAKAAKDKQREQADTNRMAAQRQENLKRMQGLAGATGAPSATGTADRSSGPSSSYAGRIAARIKPNIVFTDVISGNPATLVEIRVAPDGTIVGKKLLESSGVKSWDEAVLRAIDKTEVLPRDTDGRVVPSFPIRFRPRD